ncbi:MAG: endonuclease/exonuclease/phosphatase family protein [Propionibacteriaceae bacterium]
MKQRTRIGTWNTKTLFAVGKLEQAEREAQRLNIDIMGISEARWTSFGEERTPGGGKFLYSGKPEGQPHEYGVCFLLSRKAVSSLRDWKPINERIITARFKSRVRYISIVQAYAPTDSAELAVKEKFYSELQATMLNINRQDIIIVMGDFNAQIGQDNTELEHIMGRHGMGTITENGELFTEFCCENELVIGGSLFPHQTCHKYTWTHHRTREGYQLDHMCISSKWRGSLLDVRNRRSADIQSDHELLVAEIRLKISRVTQTSLAALRKFDVQKLKDRKTRQAFSEKLRNLNLPQGIGPDSDINSAWALIRDGFNQTSEEILGKLPHHKEEWITDETWKMIEVRKMLKNAKDDVGRNFYRESCRACTTALRRDFRRRVEDLARDY